MSKHDKALAKLRQNPKNVRPQELDRLLLGLGFEKIPAKGSHTKYVLDEIIVVVPYQTPFLKPMYVRLVIKLLDKLDFE